MVDDLQAQYAGNIMYTLAIFLSKLSSLCFFICLTGEGSTKQRVVHGSIVCVTAWSFISIIVILLQCHFPDPWIFRAPECINLVRISESNLRWMFFVKLISTRRHSGQST